MGKGNQNCLRKPVWESISEITAFANLPVAVISAVLFLKVMFLAAHTPVEDEVTVTLAPSKVRSCLPPSVPTVKPV